MSAVVTVLAFDLGASSGRAIIGQLDKASGQLSIEEIHRFSNDPVQVGSRLHWDILRLLHEIKQGIIKAQQLGYKPESLAIDSWAVDFGLLSASGELLGNPYHYRDHHTDGVMEEVQEMIGKERIFNSTGLQFLPFNTLYQLYALKKSGSSLLVHADVLLMIPDLLRFFLTGEKHSEFTNASTTQMLSATTKAWDAELLHALDLPTGMLLQPVAPGTWVGQLSAAVQQELGVPGTPVIAVGEHDTASAVAAVPVSGRSFAYLSCGTWSLMGTELPEPVLTEQALALNFTNEGGVENTFRVLKNIMGLWIVQECKRTWDKSASSHSFAELVELASAAEPLRCFIDPDDLMFLNPAHMPKQIQHYCHETGQYVPQNEGEIIRCALESLALKYHHVLANTEQLAGCTFEGLNMVGGGINNTLLCQFTANAIGRPVWAGPVEASAIGNIIVQYIALGHLASLEEARGVVKSSFEMKLYEPQEVQTWERAFETFSKVTGCSL